MPMPTVPEKLEDLLELLKRYDVADFSVNDVRIVFCRHDDVHAPEPKAAKADGVAATATPEGGEATAPEKPSAPWCPCGHSEEEHNDGGECLFSCTKELCGSRDGAKPAE